MINRSSGLPQQQPNQVNLEQEYQYDCEYPQGMGYQPDWQSGTATQLHTSASFQPHAQTTSHAAYSDRSGHQHQISDRTRHHQFQQIREPPFGTSSLGVSARSSSMTGEDYRQSSSLNCISVDFGSIRYPSVHSESLSSLSAPSYPGPHPGQSFAGHGSAADSYTQVGPQNPNLSQPYVLPPNQSQHYRQSATRVPPIQSHQVYSDNSSYIQPSLNSRHLGAKRQRVYDDSYANYFDATGDGDSGMQREEAHKAKLGACSRCKNLKVKCEFRLDSDTCRRCLTGGHECAIPGRKKRRIPPKRETLINQIRDQAAEIQRLMQQLDLANKQISSAASPPSEGASVSDAGPTPKSNEFKHQADVEDWVAKAKESIEVFGGYIGIGTGSGPRNLIEDSDSEESDWVYDADFDSDDEYAASATGEDQESRWDESLPVYSRSSPDDGGRRKEAAGDRLASIPSQTAPFGLMANLSLRRIRLNRGTSAEAEDRDEVGVVRDDYFRAATPDPTQRVLDPGHSGHPSILTNGIITPVEADELFNVYFEYMNLSLSLLDPVLYTAHNTYYRSPFLFTVICAIASRHYSPKPDLYAETMQYAKCAAGTALISGPKTIETVHAYILLALNPAPVKKWDEDRSWLYLGLAIRVAVDLNLHIRSTAKPRNEIHARELLNRTRAWLNCFNLDRSTGSAYGKGPMLPNSDYIANHSGEWWRTSEYNMRGFDIHLCAYNADLRLMGNFRAKIYSNPDHPTGLNKEIDFEKLASETDDQLVALRDYWLPTLAENVDPDDRHAQFRTGLIKLAYSYGRLVVLSFGFQRAGGRSNFEDNPFIIRCLRAASDVCLVLLDDLNVPGQRIFLRHGPEAQSVFVTFAAAFLVKLLHPKFMTCFSMEQRQGMHEMVQRVAEALGSPDIAIDDHHGPKLYSRFLQGLLDTAKFDPTSTRRTQRPKTSSQSPRPSCRPTTPVTSLEPSLLPSPAPSSVVGEAPYGYPSQPEQQGPPGPSIPSMDLPEFFVAPVSFDKEMLQSMHTLANSTDWNGMMALPGWNWMGQFQPGNDVEMNDGVVDSRTHYADEQFMQ